MLSRLKTAAQGGSADGSAGSSSVDGSGKWGRKGGGRPAERDQFRVQQQGFYVRGDLTVDVFQARGLRLGTAGERNPYCVVLVDRMKVGETLSATKTLSPVWNHPVRVPHESLRRAADTNAWPVPYQPLSIQVWDRSNTSDTLLGTARIPITEVLGNGDGNGWYRLVGTGEQAGVEEVCGKIRVKVHWESDSFATTPEDYPRLFLRDVFGFDQKDYQHLYYGGLCSTMLCPPAGEEILLEMMLGISRHDITANNHGKGVEGMLVLTELRLLFLPDISVGSTSASFLEFNTVQVYLAAVRNFSHRGLEGGSRLLSITTRDGRFVHFRMPAMASSARCAAWFHAECPQQKQRRGGGLLASGPPESAQEEVWKRGLWGAGTSELWMERLVDEIRWRKTSGDFVALWGKLRETSAYARCTSALTASSNAATAPMDGGGLRSAGYGYGGGGHNASSSQYRNVGTIGAASSSSTAARLAAAGGSGVSRGDLADGCAALERDLERMGVPAAGGGGGASYAATGRQMWEFKAVNKDYALSRTYPQMLAFPSSITPAQLTMAAPQRSRSRIPALVWLHPASKAPLCRSSQPMAGMTTKVLSEDIYLLKKIRVTLDTSKISIVDARSLLNAKANQVTGKGYEDVNDIGRDVCTLGFMGIENIHSVRDSLAAFCAASQAQGQEYYHAVGASGWLRHLSQIMKGAAFVVDELQRGVAVLVHCSDGWDRTAQLTALAQLYMDPYYRTLAGFEVLVEKEWCSFGHMFGLRAHSDSPTESSPVFLQWLDTVWQLVRQYPSSFEFTGHYLERLVEGLYSAGFINFAGNCERERKEKLKDLKEAGSGALSLFAYLREHATEGHMTAPLLNPLYRPPANSLGGANGRVPAQRSVDVLRPCCELQGLEIWQQVYMRDNLLLHHREQQLSVEQGLRLQVYDYRRRIALIEASMGRLPRGLKTKLQASAIGISSPEWDRHDRLVDQLSADKEAAVAQAVAIASGSAVGTASASASASASAARGRSQSRNTRSGTNDDGSRSRSRSFTLPLRGWGGGKGGAHGERRHRWASQDSDSDYRGTRADTDYRSTRVDTDIEEEGIHRSVSRGSSLDSGDVTGDVGDDEDELEERPSRSKSFFGGFGKWGGRRRRGVSAAEVESPLPGAGAGDSGDDGGTTDRSIGGSGAGITAGGDHKTDGGGGSRRRLGSSSAAQAFRGVMKRSESSSLRNNRFSSFTGERPMAASSDAAEPAAAVTSHPAPQKLVESRTAENHGRSLRSHSMVVAHSPTAVPEPAQSARHFGRKKGWGRGKTTTSTSAVAAVRGSAAATQTNQEPEPRRRVLSTGAAPSCATPRNTTTRSTLGNVATPGRNRWGRGRVNSSAGVASGEDDLGRRRRALSTTAAAPSGGGGVGGGSGSGSAATVDDFRSNSVFVGTPAVRGSVADGDVGAGGGGATKGVFRRTKGVWGSFQRTLGGGQPNKSTPEPAEGWKGTRKSPHPAAAGEGTVSAHISTASSEFSEGTKANSGDDVVDEEEDAAGDERVAILLKAEVETKARRDMEHTITTLEMRLLIKEIVDTACLRAAERASEKSSDRSSGLSDRLSLKFAPLSVSSSVAPEPLARLSTTALQSEQRTFFGKFWTASLGGTGSDVDNGEGGGGGAAPGAGGFAGARGGGGVTGHWGGSEREGERQMRRHSNAGSGTEPPAIWKNAGARDAEPAGKSGDGDKKEEEEGFFHALRRKIFEGDKEERREQQKPARESDSAGSEMPASLRFTPVRAAAAAPRVEANGDASGSRQRSQSTAGVGAARAGAGAGPGVGGYSRIVAIPPLPLTAGTPPANHPDAGAGGKRSAERSASAPRTAQEARMVSDVAEAAAAKFGLVRMDYGK